jgi:hypothetical protein
MVGEVFVNGASAGVGELMVERNDEVVWSRGPRPDKAWTFVDANGHFHAYDQGDEQRSYPTLRATSEHRECNGSCGGACEGEGYDVTVYSCLACGEVIKPGLIEGEYSISIPRPYEWSARAGLPAGMTSFPGSDLVSIRLNQHFGFAYMTDMRIDFDGRGSALYVGTGPLGRSEASPSSSAASGDTASPPQSG